MNCRLPHHARGWRAAVFGAALIAGLAQASLSIVQTADSNAGLQGGQDHLFDAILGTPGRKTPGPQDKISPTAPGAGQAAPAPQSKTKATGTPPAVNRMSPGEHR